MGNKRLLRTAKVHAIPLIRKTKKPKPGCNTIILEPLEMTEKGLASHKARGSMLVTTRMDCGDPVSAYKNIERVFKLIKEKHISLSPTLYATDVLGPLSDSFDESNEKICYLYAVVLYAGPPRIIFVVDDASPNYPNLYLE